MIWNDKDNYCECVSTYPIYFHNVFVLLLLSSSLNCLLALLSFSLGCLWLWDLRLFIGLSNLWVSLSSSWMSLGLFSLCGAFSWRSLWANVSSDEQCNTSNSEVCDGINEFSMESQWIHPRVVDHSDGSNGESIQSDTCNLHAEKN